MPPGTRLTVSGQSVSSQTCGKPNCKAKWTGGICCDSCAQWWHYNCTSLGKQLRVLYETHKKLQWVCKTCLTLLEEVRQKKEKETKVKDGAVDQAEDRSLGELRTDEATKEMKQAHTLDINGIDLQKKDEHSMTSRVTESTQIKASNMRTKTRGKSSKDIGGQQEESEDELDKRILGLIKKHVNPGLFAKQVNQGLRDRVTKLESQTEVALGRHRNVVLYGIEEPQVEKVTERRQILRANVEAICRAAGVTLPVGLKRYFRLGKWVNTPMGTARKPRPVLLELTNPRVRDELLAAAGKIAQATNGKVRIKPDHLHVSTSCAPKKDGDTKVQSNKKETEHRIINQNPCVRTVNISTSPELDLETATSSKNGAVPRD